MRLSRHAAPRLAATLLGVLSAASPALGGMTGARLLFEPSDAVCQAGSSMCLATKIRQTAGGALVVEPGEFSLFQPANPQGRVFAAEGSLSGLCIAHMKELAWDLEIAEAGDYEVWMRARFPLAANYNHGERMDGGEMRVMVDSADAAKIDKYAPLPDDDVMTGKWLEPGVWHWYKDRTYTLSAGRHRYEFPANGAWCGGCVLDRIVFVKKGPATAAKAEAASAENRAVLREERGSAVSRPVGVERIAKWRFDATFDKGDGDVSFDCSYGGGNWIPFEEGQTMPVPEGAGPLRIRATLVAGADGGIPPTIGSFRFSVEKKEVAEAGSTTEAPIREPGIAPLRIVPNKIVYPLGEKGWATICFTNTADEAKSTEFAVTEAWGLDDGRRDIFAGTVALGPKESKTVRVDWPGSDVRYGHELRVATADGASRSEFFNVNDDWWRVNQGCRMETARGMPTPGILHLLAYYGYGPGDWADGAGWMLHRQWERQAPGMGPFLSYHTLETRWQMQQSSVGGNLVTTTYPDDETWITPNGSYPRRTGDIRRDTEAAHAWGFHHTRFTINLMEGPPGLELARRHPEYILRNERGQFMGLYADTDPVKISVPNNRQRYPWTYVEPNLFREDVFDWAIKDLVDCVLALGEDGVYFDGRYVKKQGFDAFGNDLAKTCGVEACAVRNLERTKAAIFGAKPDAYVWSNGGKDGPEMTLASHPQCGILNEKQWNFLLNPSRQDHSYRGFFDSVLRTRDVVWRPGRYVKTPSKILHCGYLSTRWDPAFVEKHGEGQVMAQHVMAILAAACCHPFAGSPPMRPFKQMMTRYSELFWHEDNEIVPDARKSFSCDSLRDVWFEDTVYVRETPGFTQYTIHLVNAPEQEFCDDTVTDDPPAADDVRVSTTLFGAAGAKAWAIRPSSWLDSVLEPRCTELSVETVGGRTSVAVPPFDYYTLLVIRVPK